MKTLTISLPEPLQRFVEGQIATGRYRTASDYIHKLIRDDEQREADEQLEERLLEGANKARLS